LVLLANQEPKLAFRTIWELRQIIVIPFEKVFADRLRFHENFVVPDVAARQYIACSFTVKSEVVVPVNGGADYK
jgi:putative methionine-R-sulfoxide reductase with GAF domain